jgi:hypothetical protein
MSNWSDNSDSYVQWDAEVAPNCELIWEEYKHRHDLCWNLIFRLTYVVVIISVVPYIKPDVAQKLGFWIVTLPIIGIALTAFGLLRLHKELAILSVIRARHRNLQGLLYYDQETGFSAHATRYLFCLLGLGVINTFVILCKWLPQMQA